MTVAEQLASDHRVVLMECRGAGESEHTTDGYTLEQYAALARWLGGAVLGTKTMTELAWGPTVRLVSQLEPPLKTSSSTRSSTDL